MKSYTEKLHKELLLDLEELDRIYDPMVLNDPPVTSDHSGH